MLYKETVAAPTLDLIFRIMADERLCDFYLVGGTALSLTIGHRISDDIDLFTGKDFDEKELAEYLRKYRIENLRLARNTISCFIEDVKVDLIAHQYELLQPVKETEGIRMLSTEDIAAMKLNAITQDGTRLKDFIDIYYLLEQQPLKTLLEAYQQKYAESGVSRQVACKALLYDKDIDFTIPVHFMNKKEIKWPEIVQRFQAAIHDPGQVFAAKRLGTINQRKSDKQDIKRKKRPDL